MRGRLGLSAQALKWIAMVSMLIDHVGKSGGDGLA